jgi:hypothetical protein
MTHASVAGDAAGGHPRPDPAERGHRDDRRPAGGPSTARCPEPRR